MRYESSDEFLAAIITPSRINEVDARIEDSIQYGTGMILCWQPTTVLQYVLELHRSET